MDDQAAFKQMEEWGYYLLPHPHPNSPGYSGLLVALRETPTRLHFDPEAIHVELCDLETGFDSLDVTLATPMARPRQVCPGSVVLSDRTGKRIHFFVFGGLLECTCQPGEAVYSLTSPAPILEILGYADSPPEQLAMQVQARLAELRTGWGLDESGFTSCLACQDALQFYQACLQSILKRYERAPGLRHSYHEFYEMLRREKKELAQAGQWSAGGPGLEELMAPG